MPDATYNVIFELMEALRVRLVCWKTVLFLMTYFAYKMNLPP